jgi:hypothetical protein
MIDVVQQISSVDRRVGSRTLEAGEARTLVVSRVYDTSPEELWDACTKPGAHLPLVPADLRRPAAGRPLTSSRATRPGRSSAASPHTVAAT